MANTNLKIVLEQAGSIKNAFDRIISEVQSTIASIDRMANVRTEWLDQVTAGQLDAAIPQMILDFIPVADLQALRQALITFRDAHQGT